MYRIIALPGPCSETSEFEITETNVLMEFHWRSSVLDNLWAEGSDFFFGVCGRFCCYMYLNVMQP